MHSTCTLVRIVHTAVCILVLHRYCWSTSAGPGNSPSRQGTSDGRRAERASSTNETKNNVMEMAAYIAIHSRYSSTVCIHVRGVP